MQDCFRKYPEVYGEEIADEEAAEAEAAAANSAAPNADVKDTTPKATAPEAPSQTIPSPEPHAKAEENKPGEGPGLQKKVHDATADASQTAGAADPSAASKAADLGHSQTVKDDLEDRQLAIPKRSFDATSANTKESR